MVCNKGRRPGGQEDNEFGKKEAGSGKEGKMNCRGKEGKIETERNK